ncbi:MAG: putative ABC transporter permease subunit, partial [Thermoguttaceae bacterium]
MNQASDCKTRSSDFLSPAEESAVFWRLRRRIIKKHFAQILSRRRLRASLIVFLSLLLWGGLFVLFLEGFHFLRIAVPHAEIHDEMVRVVFSLFFAALMVMLMFSSGIIMYGFLFHSSETVFLLSLPARTQKVFLHKFQEAVLLS